MNFINKWLVCFIVSLLVISGCKQKEIIPELSTEEQPEMNININVPDSDSLSVITSMPLAKLDWFFNRYGKSTWYYETQINPYEFSEDEMKQLLKTVLSSNNELNCHQAAYALQYSFYTNGSQETANENFIEISDVLYKSPILQSLVKQSPTIIRYISQQQPDYLDIAVMAVKSNPLSFDVLPLTIKMNSSVLVALFNSKDFFHHGEIQFQKRALAYSSKRELAQFMQRDGLLLQYLPPRYKDDPFVVLSAVKQTKEAETFASTRLQQIINRQGIKGLLEASEPTEPDIAFTTETDEDGLTKTTYDFLAEDNIVLDSALINRIEVTKSRTVTQLWQLGNAGQYGSLYLAVFQPTGPHFLASLVYEKSDTDLIFNDFPATYSKKTPDTLWFKNDSGIIGPHNFKMLSLISVNDSIQIEYTRINGEVSASYRLIESNKGRFKQSTLL